MGEMGIAVANSSLFPLTSYIIYARLQRTSTSQGGVPEGHHGGTAAILGAVGGHRPATDGIHRGFESPANRDKAAIKREESEARFDYPEPMEQREPCELAQTWPSRDRGGRSQREQARPKVSGYRSALPLATNGTQESRGKKKPLTLRVSESNAKRWSSESRDTCSHDVYAES